MIILSRIPYSNKGVNWEKYVNRTRLRGFGRHVWEHKNKMASIISFTDVIFLVKRLEWKIPAFL
jgi:hypothetical protein